MTKQLLLLLIICGSINLLAQTSSDKKLIILQTNVQVLENLKKNWELEYEKHELLNKNLQRKLELKNGKVKYLSGYDTHGNAVYDEDENSNAAKTSFIDKIWSGGSTGLELTGTGIEIGHWEAGGLALTTHNELSDKITHIDNEPITSHATHTAGTMIGKGSFSSARGMASSATIKSWKSNSNESEMASFALGGGILSNHSYATGNPDGEILEYGAYNTNAGEWDDIVYNAPFFTICKSAGNNRNDGVNTGDNGYDIIYSVSGSKNVLTVGAVEDISSYTGPSSVLMPDFSNWGPTDDWRIKPDLVTNGVDIFSAHNTSNSSYTTKPGTSMAAAVTTGTIALLQEHYHNLNGVYMKAATVKSLLICTTEEAGANDGPDFKFGWGLLNAEKAAAVISNNGSTSLISELSLTNNTSYSKQIQVDGSSQIAVSIAWTDPKGSPVSGTDNQTPMLVNDLDIRITKDATTFSPWVMTPNVTSNNFTDAATKGDNFRDNVERIDVNSLTSGIYTITVNHKGTLYNSNNQDFSLVVRGVSNASLSTNDIDLIENNLIIYPNPSIDGMITIQNEKNTILEGYVKIFDLQGRLIHSKIISSSRKTLNLSHLTTGIYFVEVKTNNETLRKRLIMK